MRFRLTNVTGFSFHGPFDRWVDGKLIPRSLSWLTDKGHVHDYPVLDRSADHVLITVGREVVRLPTTAFEEVP